MGGARKGTMQLPCLALAPLNSLVRLIVSPTRAPAIVHSQLSFSFLFSQPHPHGPPPCRRFSLSALLVWLVWLTLFNSLVVGVPYSLIFWHFWLFINFRLVVIFLLVVWGSEGFLPTPPSWLELSSVTFDALFIPTWWTKILVNCCSTLMACNVLYLKFSVVFSFIHLHVVTTMLIGPSEVQHRSRHCKITWHHSKLKES